MFYRRKLLPLYIAATLASGQVAAVGLGDLSLHSYLGKPLQAEVALSHMGDLSADQLKVQIGSESDYGAMGVEYNYLHSRLRIEPFVRDGQAYVRISSNEPITEPYLNFVLNLRWPQGQVVREFTVLLDPAPETAVASRSSMQAAPLDSTSALADAATAAVESAPVAREAARPVHRAARVAPVASTAAAEPRTERPAGGTYTTQRGDSLWRLAAKLRPSTAVSVEQMMAALHSANPDAFVGGNAARLKEAATLDVAAAERIALQGGTAPASGPATAIAAATSAAPAKASAPVAAPAAVAVPEGLVQENAALKAQVADLSQNVATLNTSLAQSTDRVHEMEARLDSVLQQFQQQRMALAGETATAAAAVAQPGAMINQVNAAELRPAPPAHTPLWVHSLYWAGIAAAMAWAIREHFWPARRLAAARVGGDADRDGHADAIVPVAPLGRMAPVDAAPAAAQPWKLPESADDLTLDLGDILPPDDETAAAASDDIELALPRQPEEQVDASISAGVFVAFGRFDEAERLLRDALRQDPARDDLKLQLLDVYLQSDQAAAFEQLAQDIERSQASVETLAELAVLRDSFQSRD